MRLLLIALQILHCVLQERLVIFLLFSAGEASYHAAMMVATKFFCYYSFANFR